MAIVLSGHHRSRHPPYPMPRSAMPGADWHLVNAEGREVPTALQYRLRKLGESPEIVIVK
jgi:hypothetical protein